MYPLEVKTLQGGFPTNCSLGVEAKAAASSLSAATPACAVTRSAKNLRQASMRSMRSMRSMSQPRPISDVHHEITTRLRLAILKRCASRAISQERPSPYGSYTCLKFARKRTHWDSLKSPHAPTTERKRHAPSKTIPFRPTRSYAAHPGLRDGEAR